MEIVQLPVLRDNYIYLLHDARTGMTAAVDPADDERAVARTFAALRPHRRRKPSELVGRRDRAEAG